MARTKAGTRSAVIVDLPEAERASDDETEDKTPAEAAADDQLAELENEQPGQLKATIWRIDDATGQEEFCGKGISAQVLIRGGHEWIAKNLGGGNYKAEIRKPRGPKGGMVYAKTLTFDVNRDIPRKIPPWYKDAVAEIPTAVAASNGHTPSMFETMALQMMTQQMQAQQTAAQQQAATQAAALAMQQQQMQAAAEASRQQMQMQLEMMRQQGEASRAASEQQSRMMQAFMESMRASMSSAPKLSDTFGPFIPLALEMLKARKDPMEIAAHIAQLMKPSGNDASTVAGALALVEKGLTIGREMAPGGGEPATWLDVGREALHALPAAAAAIRGNPNGNGQQVPAQVVQNPPPTNGAAPPTAVPLPPLPLPAPKGGTTEPVHSPDMMLQATLRPIAIELQQRCDANADPDQTADLLFERYAAFRGPMLSFTNEPGYQDKLMGMFPEQLTGQAPNGSSRAPWVRRVMAELAELLREPPE